MKRLCAIAVLAVLAACGQKGPPLPPLRPLPAPPTEVTARRVSDRVVVSLVVPSVNQDPTSPLSLSRVDIYARSLGYGSVAPVITQLLDREFLVGSIEVRPAPDASVPPPVVSDPSAPVDSRPAPGERAVWSESLQGFDVRPLSLTREQETAVAAQRPFALPLPPTGLAVPFTPIVLPTRYYVAVGVSAQGRNGAASMVVPVRLGGAPAAPTDPTLTYTETTLTLTWTAPAGAPVRVYASSADGVEAASPVQAAPITTGTWAEPVVFGEARCFTVRQVLVAGPVSTESAPAGPVCTTPVDTFPPAVPGDLRGASEPGRVILEWAPVTTPDVAGYHVLRAEGAGATLQALTTTPVVSTGYVDLTAQVDVEYRYVVVAIDRAGNLSAQSNTITVTGR
ncbi:MAG: lipoprotein [Acidobacteria bacterium]|nr:lipoprotein [Acidobacteriota bacterium]